MRASSSRSHAPHRSGGYQWIAGDRRRCGSDVVCDVPARGVRGLPEPEAVSRTGVGYDEIDVEAATEYGVAVCNVPGYGTEVVSDHAITLALSVLRRINELDADMRRGVWDYARTRPLGQCRGRVFGVVGMGEIGRAAAKKAAGMGFEVVCWSRSLKPGRRTPEGYPCCAWKSCCRRRTW
mgnify:CR=1 FL=1